MAIVSISNPFGWVFNFLALVIASKKGIMVHEAISLENADKEVIDRG